MNISSPISRIFSCRIFARVDFPAAGIPLSHKVPRLGLGFEPGTPFLVSRLSAIVWKLKTPKLRTIEQIYYPNRMLLKKFLTLETSVPFSTHLSQEMPYKAFEKTMVTFVKLLPYFFYSNIMFQKAWTCNCG